MTFQDTDLLITDLLSSLMCICNAVIHPVIPLVPSSYLHPFVLPHIFTFTFSIPLRLLPPWQLITHQPLRPPRQPAARSAGFPDRCWAETQRRRRGRATETVTEEMKTEGRETRLNWSLTSLMSEPQCVVTCIYKQGMQGLYIRVCESERQNVTECISCFHLWTFS